MPVPPILAFFASTVVVLSVARAQSAPPAPSAIQQMTRFAKLATGRQDHVVALVDAAVAAELGRIDDPWLAAVRSLVAEAGERRPVRVRGVHPVRRYTSSETAVSVADPLIRQLPIAATVTYQFGFGAIVDYCPGGEKPTPIAASRRQGTGTARRARRAICDRLAAAALGALVEQLRP